MKSRSNLRSLACRILGGTCGAIMLFLVICPSSPGGLAQEPPRAAKTVRTAEALDVPYWGDKVAREKLAKAPFGIITDISTRRDGVNLVVSVSASCKPFFEEFRLADPPRLVVDFLNVENRTPFYSHIIGNSGIRQLRIAQFQGAGPTIARLVFDLNKGFSDYEIVTDSEGMRITFAPGPDATASAAPPAAAPPPQTGVNPAVPATPDATKAAPAKPAPPVGEPAKKPDVPGIKSPAAGSVKPPAATEAPKPLAAPPAPDPAKQPAATEAPGKTVSQPISAPTAAASPAASGKPPAIPEVTKVQKETAKASPPPEPPKTAPPAGAIASPNANRPQQKPEVVTAPAPSPAPIAAPPAGPGAAAPQPPGQPAEKSAGTQPVTASPAANPTPGGYSGHPLTLDLVNFALVDFFRLMAEEGGINIVVDPDVKGTASIKMTKTPWDQIFDVVLRNNGLEKQVDGTVVRIATKKTLQAEAKQIADLKKEQLLAADIETRVRRLNYANAKTLIAVLQDQMTVRGTIVVDERSGSLVLTDVPEALDKVIDLINMLDMPEPQVEIEARIVSATRDFARDIGVQFGFVQGNLQRVTAGGPNTFGTIGGTRPSATPTNTYVGGNPVTGRGASQSSTTESGGISAGASATNNAGNYNVNLPSKLPFGGAGISVGNILDTFLLDAAITAGESKGQAKLISQPKLTTQNNNPGVITQGLRFPVQVVANNTVTVQFQNAALTLTVTPQITVDGNIVLDLKVENNTPDFTRQVMGIPSIRTSESSTRVLVKDGGTTVIGGIIIENETTQEDRVPGLASLPLLGNLFKRSSVSRNSQEVLFFITPRVVK